MLQTAGISQFHSGRAVRVGGRWDGPMNEGLVRRLKQAITLDILGVPRV
jgi:hypothetical protein